MISTNERLCRVSRVRVLRPLPDPSPPHSNLTKTFPMLASRLAQRHLLNGAFHQFPKISTNPLVVRPTLARSTPTILNQNRQITIETVPPNEAASILASQRLNRPISPHLGIYKPQITWYGSALTRITGAVLSGGP